jgi:hypothetical protein
MSKNDKMWIYKNINGLLYMPLHRTSDSLSPCDPHLYSSMYDVRQRPDIKRQPLSEISAPKDTIEISKDQLKKEALNRLRHTTQYPVSHHGFMRIGKYLFLAIAFPPYLLIYGLPRWVVLEGIATFSSLFLWIGQKVHKPIDRVQQRIVHLFEFVKEASQALIRPVVLLTLEIRQQIRRMDYSIRPFVQRVRKKLREEVNRFRFECQKGMKRVTRTLTQVKERIVYQLQKVSEKFQQGIQTIKQAPLLFLGWRQGLWQRLNERTVSVGQSWNKRFQISQQLSLRGTEWVVQHMRRLQMSFMSTLKSVVSFYQQHLQPQWLQLKVHGKEKWKQTRDFFRQKHQKMQVFLEKQQEKIKQLSHGQWIDHLLARYRWMHHHAWFKRWLTHPLIRTIGEALMRVYFFLTIHPLRLLMQLGERMSHCFRYISEYLTHLKISCRSVGRQVQNHIQQLLTASRRVAWRSLYYFLVFITMFGIVLIWGIQSLREFTLSFMAKYFPSFKVDAPQ